MRITPFRGTTGAELIRSEVENDHSHCSFSRKLMINPNLFCCSEPSRGHFCCFATFGEGKMDAALETSHYADINE
jgi:hypothetical protein